MGIRYERDEFKPTNGPVLFFTGMTSGSPLARSIDAANEKRLSFYAYKLPYQLSATFGSTEHILTGLSEPGFIIGHFDPELPLINIPFRYINEREPAFPYKYEMPEKSTSKEDFHEEVKDILKETGDSDIDKIVAARVLNLEGNFDPGEIFDRLCVKYPEAFVFCFSTPATGLWLGATPELLLEARESKFSTMALAGTMPADKEGSGWDEKNIKEQQTVSEFILDTLAEANLKPFAGNRFSRKAGDLIHLCTPIEADIPGTYTVKELESLLKRLSPTPAISGFPKESAMEFIRKHESFDRALYGGFCGPFQSITDFNFNVSIRCGAFSEKKTSLYAGCGVRKGSDPLKEWEETENKLSTLLSTLNQT